MTTELRGKTALVTGAAKRVGRTIALKLAEAGVNIVFNYRKSADEAEETRRDLIQSGVEALALQSDLNDLDSCEEMIETANQRLGHIDILVNNASDFGKTPLEKLDGKRSDFMSLFDHHAHLHMRAPLFLGIRLGRRMKERGWGRIVSITDRVVVKGQAYPDYAVYLATKYGLYGVSQVLAEELTPEVTVNSIAPGLIVPPPDWSEEFKEEIRQQIPLKREAGTAEIAADVFHLIQSDSKTGSVILTDGGAGVHTY